LANVFRILSISPTRYAKVNANPPQIDVILTYTGADPKFAAYRSDGGAWVTANVPLSIQKSGTAKVTIPSSVFQNSTRSVDVLLNNDQTQAFGTIAVMNVDPTVQAKEVKALQNNLNTPSTGTTGGTPGGMPQSTSKSTQQLAPPAPSKSSGSVFQR
jgi:hypothetical protein